MLSPTSWLRQISIRSQGIAFVCGDVNGKRALLKEVSGGKYFCRLQNGTLWLGIPQIWNSGIIETA
jgi:hypothetical protein